MYDELVKRLNAYSAEHENHGGITAEAADAIEEILTNYDAATEIMKHQTDYIEELEAKLPRWIPVTERLPEIRKVVLITDGIDVGTGWMNQGWWNTSFADIQRDAVTHWMPLPEPPKEG